MGSDAPGVPPEGGDALTEVLNVAAKSPITAEIVGRAEDTGHLTAEEMEAWVAGRLDPEVSANLRRHIVFCRICSDHLFNLTGEEPPDGAEAPPAPPAVPEPQAPARAPVAASPPAPGVVPEPPASPALPERRSRRPRLRFLLPAAALVVAAAAFVLWRNLRPAESGSPPRSFVATAPERPAGPLAAGDLVLVERAGPDGPDVRVHAFAVASSGDTTRLEAEGGDPGRPLSLRDPLRFRMPPARGGATATFAVVILVAESDLPAGIEGGLASVLEKEARAGGAGAVEGFLRRLVAEGTVRGEVLLR